MSKTKQGGSSKLGRDSQSKRLGVKVNAGQDVKIGMIIIRQRGTRYLLGKNVKKGSDDTIYAMKNGVVKFSTKSKKLFNGTRREAKVVSVVPAVATTKVAKTTTAKAK
jgi:large subunit ribosomal protein L27